MRSTMNKRLIFISVFAVSVLGLCTKLVFDYWTQPSTDRPNPTIDDVRKSKLNPPSPEEGTTSPPVAKSNAKPPPKVASGLVAGGRQWKLQFSDHSLSDEIQQRISYDLNLIFGHLPNFEIDTLPFTLGVDARQLVRRVRFEGGENRRPSVLKNSGFAHLAQGADESELFVPKAVTNAYLKAIELEKQNEAAYKLLDQFLARMSEIAEKPIEDVRGLFVFPDENKSAEGGTAKVDPLEFAAAWGGKIYRAPSILDMAATAGTPLEKYGSLIAMTYALSPGKVDDLPRLVFHSGRWRFLMERPGT